MAIVTPNLGLRLWNLGQDPYNSQQLAANFSKIDEHDHAGGRGKPLGAAALADASVSTAKLQDNSVTQPKLAAATIISATVSGWTASTVAYWKDAYGYVWMDGHAASDGATTTLFTLPAGSRPTVAVNFRVIDTTSTATQVVAAVSTGGVVTIPSGALTSGHVVDFAAVKFRTF